MLFEFRIILIGGKVIYFLYYLTKATLAYKDKNEGSLKSQETGLFALFIFLMLLIPIFDFIMPTQILMLFFMVLLSNVGVFLCFCNLAANSEGGSPSQAMLSRLKPVSIIVPIFYFTLLILGVLPEFGASCSQTWTYRKEYSCLLKMP